MLSKSPIADSVVFIKAVLSNVLAGVLPGLYVKLTEQTGRGREEESPEDVANYYARCLDDYLAELGIAGQEAHEFLAGKDVLEYGPGDNLGVALLLYANGASSVHCVDKFAMVNFSQQNQDIYQAIINNLPEEKQQRALGAFNTFGRPETGFKPSAISYRTTNDGLSGEVAAYDLIISRAVLEHVNNLEGTLLDVKTALRTGGISIHQVDLKSHGLDRYTEFDFLTWPTSLYHLMYCNKGFPNRWRVDKYRQLTEQLNFQNTDIRPTEMLPVEKIHQIKPHLAKEFTALSDEDLRWLGLWMYLAK